MTTNANTRPSEYVPSGVEVEAAAKSLAADEFRKADWNDVVMARNALVAAHTATPTPPTDMVPAAAIAEWLGVMENLRTIYGGIVMDTPQDRDLHTRAMELTDRVLVQIRALLPTKGDAS